jgi:peptidoglycan/LPS O-acetylase OafA/YrhL
MSGGALTNLVIGLLVLVLFVSRQLTTRRLRENYRILVILAVIGVVQFVAFLNGHPHHDGAIVAAVVGSLVLAAVLGALRAPTVRVWRGPDGQLLRKGTWLTAVLWAVALAAHLGYDYLVAGHVTGKNGGNVGDATVVLYLVASLAVQRYIMLTRAARQDAAGQIPDSEPKVSL